MNIVQIGANKGNDDLTSIITSLNPDKLVLVEPMKIHNEELLSSYSWLSNVYLENVAIDIVSGEEVQFFYHLDDGPGFEVASLSEEHIYKRHIHLSKDRIESLKVKTLTINDLFRKYDLDEIDILFIDAEGMDEVIIKSIDFKKYRINKIFFENLHLSGDEIYSYLEEKGYFITKKIGKYGWSSLAEIVKKINKITFDSKSSLTELCFLGNKYNTDKSPISKMELRHSYTIFYDLIFRHLKDKKIKIGEIGIWKNASIKSFRDYFTQANIHGFELVQNLIDECSSENLPNTFYHLLNENDTNSISHGFAQANGDFDIIIDDGSHHFDDQINVIFSVIPFLKSNGILIIEDVFKSIDESLFEEKILPIMKYYDSVSFIETYHEKQFTGSWDNDKILILFRNNFPVIN